MDTNLRDPKKHKMLVAIMSVWSDYVSLIKCSHRGTVPSSLSSSCVRQIRHLSSIYIAPRRCLVYDSKVEWCRCGLRVWEILIIAAMRTEAWFDGIQWVGSRWLVRSGRYVSQITLCHICQSWFSAVANDSFISADSGGLVMSRAASSRWQFAKRRSSAICSSQLQQNCDRRFLSPSALRTRRARMTIVKSDSIRQWINSNWTVAHAATRANRDKMGKLATIDASQPEGIANWKGYSPNCAFADGSLASCANKAKQCRATQRSIQPIAANVGSKANYKLSVPFNSIVRDSILRIVLQIGLN